MGGFVGVTPWGDGSSEGHRDLELSRSPTLDGAGVAEAAQTGPGLTWAKECGGVWEASELGAGRVGRAEPPEGWHLRLPSCRTPTRGDGDSGRLLQEAGLLTCAPSLERGGLGGGGLVSLLSLPAMDPVCKQRCNLL